jgi:hypothetical protein
MAGRQVGNDRNKTFFFVSLRQTLFRVPGAGMRRKIILFLHFLHSGNNNKNPPAELTQLPARNIPADF